MSRKPLKDPFVQDPGSIAETQEGRETQEKRIVLNNDNGGVRRW